MIMTTPLRVLRGILGTALTWSIPWGIAGALVRIVAPTEPGPFPSLSMLTAAAVYMGVVGALMGGVFAGIIAMRGPRRFAALTVRRIAVLGVVASLAIPVASLATVKFHVPLSLLGYVVQQLLMFTGLGATCAAATLWMHRRGSQTPPRVAELRGGLPNFSGVERALFEHRMD
jgi:hypothetical protein